MLDKHYHNSTTKRVTERVTENVVVNEHRAPTDESLRLLNEMQEKAMKNIVDRVILQDNVVNGISVLFEGTFDRVQYVKFNLNGRTITTEFRFSRMDALKAQNSGKDPEQVIGELLCLEITKAVMEEMRNSKNLDK
jgi:hypothetical protein